jgi:hypothetical protein
MQNFAAVELSIKQSGICMSFLFIIVSLLPAHIITSLISIQFNNNESAIDR